MASSICMFNQMPTVMHSQGVLTFLDNLDIIQIRKTCRCNRKMYYHTKINDSTIKYNATEIGQYYCNKPEDLQIFNKKMSNFLKYNTKLTHVRFTRKCLTDKHLILLTKSTELRALQLRNQYDITDFGLSILLIQCQIESLNIGDCQKITDHAFINMNCSRLEKFRSSCLSEEVTSVTMKKILSSPNLRSFKIYMFFNTINHGIKSVILSPKLKKIVLGELPKTIENLLKQIGDQCRELEELTIRDLECDGAQAYFTARSLAHIFHKQHQMKYLCLSNDNDANYQPSVRRLVVGLVDSKTVEIVTDNVPILLPVTIKKIKSYKNMLETPEKYKQLLTELRKYNDSSFVKMNMDEDQNIWRYKKYIVRHFKEDPIVKEVFYDEDDTDFVSDGDGDDDTDNEEDGKEPSDSDGDNDN